MGLNGEIIFFNKSAETLFCYFKSETNGNNVEMLMPKEVAMKHKSYIDNYKDRNKGVKVILLRFVRHCNH